MSTRDILVHPGQPGKLSTEMSTQLSPLISFLFSVSLGLGQVDKGDGATVPLQHILVPLLPHSLCLHLQVAHESAQCCLDVNCTCVMGSSTELTLCRDSRADPSFILSMHVSMVSRGSAELVVAMMVTWSRDEILGTGIML